MFVVIDAFLLKRISARLNLLALHCCKVSAHYSCNLSANVNNQKATRLIEERPLHIRTSQENASIGVSSRWLESVKLFLTAFITSMIIRREFFN